MPRNGSGTYSLPEAPFVANTTISSSAVNSDLSDIALALTNSIASDGQTPISGAFKLADGSNVAPSYSFSTNAADGIYHPFSGALAFTLNGVNVLDLVPIAASSGAGLKGLGGSIWIPIGVVQDFAGSVTPAGWFLCYGQTVNRTTYSELFAVIGTTFGSGDGSTTFNVPDLRGYVCGGVDNMGGSAANRLTGLVLGGAAGEQFHTLSTNEIPAHNHTASSGGMSANDPHTHTYTTRTAQVTVQSGAGAANVWTLDSGGATTGSTSVSHTHTITVANTGGGTSHNNVQYTTAFNKIIFAARV